MGERVSCLQAGPPILVPARAGGGVDLMESEFAYDRAFAEARSCLADSVPTLDESSFFEWMLIALDEAHPFGHAIYPIAEDKELLIVRPVLSPPLLDRITVAGTTSPCPPE